MRCKMLKDRLLTYLFKKKEDLQKEIDDLFLQGEKLKAKIQLIEWNISKHSELINALQDAIIEE